MTDWTEIELFKGIDLYDSFILHWEYKNNTFTINLEASIWPQSQHYEKPKENEYTCYKKAILKFSYIKEITGLKAMQEVKPTIDANNEIDYGEIEHLVRTKNGFHIIAEFGDVVISGGQLSFSVQN